MPAIDPAIGPVEIKFTRVFVPTMKLATPSRFSAMHISSPVKGASIIDPIASNTECSPPFEKVKDWKADISPEFNLDELCNSLITFL
ncbi:MAG: hypothetical protein A4E23_00094 [Methanomethylovorans sp. PtaU1.Bin073]|nr:MAG: hypothetical protein A4E23_00094 [Methanomethylovorans sp. PtaU1.Bin073]